MLTRGCGLMWEEWRRTRTATAVVLALLVGMSLLVWSMDNRKYGWPAAVWSVFSVFGLLIYLLLSQSTRNSIDASVPQRRFRLPLSSFELAFWPFVYRLAVVTAGAVFVWILSRLVNHDLRLIACICKYWLLLSALHTVVYVSPLLGRWVTGFLFFLMLWPGMLLFVSVSQGPGWQFPRTDIACMVAAVAIALAVTTASIHRIRTGGWDLFRGRRALAAHRDGAARSAIFAAPPPFRSAAGAQLWFEWRSISKSVLLLLMFLTLGFVAIQTMDTVYDLLGRPYRIDPWLGITMLLTNSAAAGLWAFANQAARNRRSSSIFVQTRPVSDFRLARGKFESAVFVILANLAVVTLILVGISVALGIFKYHRDWTQVFDIDWEWQGALLLPASLVLAWIVYWRGVFAAAVFIPISIFANNAPHYFERWVYTDALLRPAAIAAIGLAMLWLAVPFVRAYRERLLSRNALLILAAACAAMTALASALFLSYTFDQFDTLSICAINALLALLALTPFARVPLKISHARHQ